MELRVLAADSYESVIALWARAGLGFRPKGRDSRDRVVAEMADPHCRYIGLFDGERMIGVVIANYTFRRAWIERLAVDPEYRGTGLAGRLIAEAERFLNEKGALVISALIETPNDQSVRAFTKAGYAVMDEVKYYSKRPYPEA